MSAIDLNMTMVEIGSSIGSVARPKAPPAAPEAVANALCKIREAARGWRRIVRSAACSATSSAVVVAVAIGRGGERVADELDRLAREHGQPRHEARMLKRLRGAPQLVQIVLGHIRQGQLRGPRLNRCM